MKNIRKNWHAGLGACKSDNCLGKNRGLRGRYVRWETPRAGWGIKSLSYWATAIEVPQGPCMRSCRKCQSPKKAGRKSLRVTEAQEKWVQPRDSRGQSWSDSKQNVCFESWCHVLTLEASEDEQHGWCPESSWNKDKITTTQRSALLLIPCSPESMGCLHLAHEAVLQYCW